jgi:hypothetical protein
MIEVEGLIKRYRSTVTVDGFEFIARPDAYRRGARRR